MACVCVMLDERRKGEPAIFARLWRGRCMPHFNYAAEADRKVPTRRREFEGSNGPSEGKVV